MSWLNKLKTLITKSEFVVVLNEHSLLALKRIRDVTAKVSIDDALCEAVARYESILQEQFKGKRLIFTNRKARDSELEFKSFIVDRAKAEEYFFITNSKK